MTDKPKRVYVLNIPEGTKIDYHKKLIIAVRLSKILKKFDNEDYAVSIP